MHGVERQGSAVLDRKGRIVGVLSAVDIGYGFERHLLDVKNIVVSIQD